MRGRVSDQGSLPGPAELATDAYRLVLANPLRILRYLGLPWLIGVGLFVFTFIYLPLPKMANPQALQLSEVEALVTWLGQAFLPLLIAFLIVVLASMRSQVRWFRYAAIGDDSIGFWAVGVGRRELVMMLWTFVVNLASIPAFMLLLLISFLLTALTGAVGGMVGGEAVGVFAANVGGWIGSALGLVLVAFVFARLTPGLVPIAFDAKPVLGRSWAVTSDDAPALTWAYFLVLLPNGLLSLVLLIVGLDVSVIGYAVSALVSLVVSAAALVLVTRIATDRLPPPAAVRTDLSI